MDMLTQNHISDRNGHRYATSRSLIARRYDQVSSLLTAAVIILGAFVLLMAMAWLYMKTRSSATQPIIYQAFEEDLNAGRYSEIDDEPADQELNEIVVQQLSFSEALEAISDIASKVTVGANRSDQQDGVGADEKRQKGPDVGSGGPVGATRYSVEFVVANQREYSRLLDYYDIELAVISRATGSIESASRFSTGENPTLRSSDTKRESGRRPVLPRERQIQAWDAEFIKQAGIKFDSNDQIMRQMWPNELIRKMVTLDSLASQKHGIEVEQNRRIQFALRKTQKGFEIRVSKIALDDGEVIHLVE